MDIWQKARSFAEEAAKRSQDLTIGPSKISDLVSETTRRSKEIAGEASRRADQIKIEALRRAGKIKTLADHIPGGPVSFVQSPDAPLKTLDAQRTDLEKFGVTDDLKDFVKGITSSTFRNFPLKDDPEVSDVPTISNVRQDLTEWQEKHASLVLSIVKEISKLRYELCPRVMKERKFWRIYFLLVNSHVAPIEKHYNEEISQKSSELLNDDGVEQVLKVTASNPKQIEMTKQSETSSSSIEQDLDVFLLGDLGDSDDGPDDAAETFDDDFDKMDSSEGEKE